MGLKLFFLRPASLLHACQLCAAYFLAVLGLLTGSAALAKKPSWKVQYFSDTYYATVMLSQSNKQGSKSHTIAVYKHGRKKPVLVQGDSVLDSDDLELGGKDVLMYQDMNFDGVPDFALKDGNRSCYGGPSYKVYLADGDDFVYHSGLSALAHEKCGMFTVDTRAKHIRTMTKSGCCWHEYNTYQLVNNAPKLVESTTESVPEFSEYYMKMTIAKPNLAEQLMLDAPAKLSKRTVYLLSMQDAPIFSFKLKNKQKTAVVFVDDNHLDYALLDTPVFPLSEADVAQAKLYKGNYHSPKIDFSAMLAFTGHLPDNAKKRRQWQRAERAKRSDDTSQSYPSFVLNKGSLSFANDTVRYSLVDKPGQLGIVVELPATKSKAAKRVFLSGEPKTKRGSVAAVKAQASSLVNVQVR